MPIFEYQCRSCSHKFEELVSSGESVVACPRCGSSDTRKLLSVFASSGGAGSGSGSSCRLPGSASSGFG